jgi:hypothetical protein
MPDYEKLLQASMPEALDSPIHTVNFVYQNADQLLQANVSALDDLNYCVFAYFNRDEIFYLNQSGRRIISPYQSPIERRLETTKFGLETAALASNDDRDVIESCPPKHHVRELISLSWGIHGFADPSTRSEQTTAFPSLFFLPGAKCSVPSKSATSLAKT